jgi:hypothetical protein
MAVTTEKLIELLNVEQAEQLKEFALAQQLRDILAMEQEHAMDMRQALGE